MTPKEFAFLCEMIVDAAQAGYRLREREIKEKKAFNDQQFKMGKNSQLTLRSQMSKKLKNR